MTYQLTMLAVGLADITAWAAIVRAAEYAGLWQRAAMLAGHVGETIGSGLLAVVQALGG